MNSTSEEIEKNNNEKKIGEEIELKNLGFRYTKFSRQSKNYKLVNENDLKILIAKMKSKQIRLEFLKTKKLELEKTIKKH